MQVKTTVLHIELVQHTAITDSQFEFGATRLGARKPRPYFGRRVVYWPAAISARDSFGIAASISLTVLMAVKIAGWEIETS